MALIQYPIMDSILVTGATGFIGSRLSSVLVDKGYKVSSLVRKGKKHTEKETDEIVGDLTEPGLSFGERTLIVFFIWHQILH